MAIKEQGRQVTEHELQYARRVLAVLVELIEQRDPDVMRALRALGEVLTREAR
jgi:hypothetical protein